VLNLLLPQVLNVVFQLVPIIKDVGPWVTLMNAVRPLGTGEAVTSEQWGQMGTSSLLWIALSVRRRSMEDSAPR